MTSYIQPKSRRIFIGLIGGLVVIAACLLGLPKVVPNSELYISLATGHAASVMKPFSSRILHPWMASILIHWGLTVQAAFIVLATGALAALLLCISSAVRWFGAERLAWPLLLLCPVLVEYFRTVYMNDLLHAALLGLLFVALARAERFIFPVLVALVMCRESTILVAFVLLFYFAWQKKYGYAAGTVLSVILGFFIVSRFAPAASHNIHSLSTGAYIAEKTGWNFLANWLGLRLWRPTFEWSCPVPLFQTKLPLLKMDVVVCNWDPEAILTTWTNFLAIISLSVGALWAGGKSTLARLDARRGDLLLVIAAYGLLAGIVGTFTGTATHRLIGYGWPLIWIVVPVVFNTSLNIPGTSAWMFLHWALMWIRQSIPPRSPLIELVFCAAVIALNVLAFRSMSARLKEDKSPPELPLREVLTIS